MKRILITGADSYIGTSFEKYINTNFPGEFSVDTVDMIGGMWRDMSFSGYDSVFHVAGIAHSDNGKISAEKEKIYYSVNTDLTIETAKKAKSDGAGQFIFMSSAIVYGKAAPIGKKKVITKTTMPNPENCYARSKVLAEEGINKLADDTFKVCILRPPMIYGKGSKGNYPLLAKLALKIPIFPEVGNERSVLYVENLCEFVRLMIENGEQGVFLPQNDEYVSTGELVRMIAAAHGKNVALVKGFGSILKIAALCTGLVNKAFGSLSYDMSESEYKQNYRIVKLKESIQRTESGE